MSSKNINVFFLAGNYDQRKNIINKIKEKLGKFDLCIFGKEISYEYLEQQIREGSCFDDKKLIIINDLPTTKKPRNTLLNNLKKLLSDVPENCIVVLDNLNISSKTFLSHLESIGKIYNFDQKKTKLSAKGFIVEYFNSQEKTISDDDAFFIVDSLSFNKKEIDIDSLNIILKKIEQYVGNNKKISKEDIINVCSSSKDFIIWDLFNALDEKNISKSLVSIDRAVSFGQDVKTQATIILYTLLRRYKLLLMVNDSLTKKKSKEEIWEEISKLIKMEREGSDVKTRMIKKEEESSLYSKKAFDFLFNSFYGKKPTIFCYKRKDLLLIDYALGKALVKIRFDCDDSEVILTLHIICMVICGVLKKRQDLRMFDNKSCVFAEN